MIRAYPDPHKKIEVGRGNSVRRGRPDDLVELFERIEAESLHSIVEIGFDDGFLGLDRMHET